MTRGTTPLLPFNFKKTLFDLSAKSFSQIWITLMREDGAYEKTWDIDSVVIDTTNNRITLKLSQEETLAMPEGEMLVQIRFKETNGEAPATNKKKVNVRGILKDGVIE